MLFYTVLQVLFSCVYGFGPKKYLSTPDLRKWHNNPYIFAITKYGNFLQHGLRSGIHLVCLYNLFDAIWCNIKWKQGVWRLFAITSTSFCLIYSWKIPHCLVSRGTTEQELHIWKRIQYLWVVMAHCVFKLNWTHNCHAPAMALSSKYKLLCSQWPSNWQTFCCQWSHTKLIDELRKSLSGHLFWLIDICSLRADWNCLNLLL